MTALPVSTTAVSSTEDVQVLPTPAELHAALPLSPGARAGAEAARREVGAILDGRDDRLLVVVGPCSVHDAGQALEYAERLAALRARVSDRLCLLMRVYVDKPRTTVGWRGYLLDPDMNGSFDLSAGLRLTRDLMRRVLDLGVPVATEVLDPLLPAFLEDALSWAAVGARTTESQTHRALASGLLSPVGFKNSTDGNVQVAVDAVAAARAPQPLLAVGYDGRLIARRTRGNPHAHVILRGGRGEPNYSAFDVARALAALEAAGQAGSLVVDCSHGNSGYDHTRQETVLREVLAQRAAGVRELRGVMIESNLAEGRQRLGASLEYGVSVTDACVGWAETERMLLEAHAALL